MKKLCIFGGSSAGHDPAAVDQAKRIGGLLLAARGFGIVFGGGRIGMMGLIRCRL